MVPSKTVLHPPPQVPPFAFPIKLNQDVLAQLHKCHSLNQKPKLVVKNGQFVCIAVLVPDQAVIVAVILAVILIRPSFFTY